MLLRDAAFLDGFAVLCADIALLSGGLPYFCFCDSVIAITPICICYSILWALSNYFEIC